MGPRWLGTVLLIGAGALVVAAVAAGPPVLRAARPVLRQGLKRGMEVYARPRAGAAEWAEDMEDLAAEVRSECAHEGAGQSNSPEAQQRSA